jgi:hypothetical protein
MDTWRLGYMNKANELVFRNIEAESCMEAIIKCMQEDAECTSICYSNCLTFKKPVDKQ